MIALVMFIVCLLMLTLGFPVAFTFGGVVLIFGLYSEGLQLFMLVAIPYGVQYDRRCLDSNLLVYIHVVNPEKSGIAERLLESMGFYLVMCVADWRFLRY